RGVAHEIRTALDQEHPDAAQINDAYSMWSKIHGFLDTARRQQVSAESKPTTGAQGLGKMAEKIVPRPVVKVASIPLGILRAMDTGPWNTVTGAAKQTIAEALARGDWGAAQAAMTQFIKPKISPSAGQARGGIVRTPAVQYLLRRSVDRQAVLRSL